jgi:hypothetical protein
VATGVLQGRNACSHYLCCLLTACSAALGASHLQWLGLYSLDISTVRAAWFLCGSFVDVAAAVAYPSAHHSSRHLHCAA